MKIRYYKLKNWLLVSLLGACGLNAGCERFSMVEYGCPEADYEVKGCVTSSDGKPVEGIEVRAFGDTVATDKEGRYDIQRSIFPLASHTEQVFFSDVDGQEHGSYADTVLNVEYRHSDLTGGDGNWYEGRAVKVLDVTLKEKGIE